jgi:RNA polymerase sigma-70 factor (ECF subfamily)
MDESLDHLFDRYRRTGDPELLARVFDRTAPRLLRAALHLSGDAAAAEDLVQATFVTAIERASSWDAHRPVEGWLTGILGNKARETRKREAREIDVDRLAQREAGRPDDEAGERETSAALVQAIDELPEAFRQPLLLRLRHGLGPAEIAHVLGESPGTVRVRLHRGIEKLRKLLPAGIVASALLVARPARGLAAVRELVIAHALSVPVAVGTGSILGGILAVKKLALAGIAVLLAILALMGGRALLRPEERKQPVAARSAERLAEADGGVSESARRLEGTPEPGERVTASPEGIGMDVVEGHVLDARTREGIGGAVIDLYPPRRSRLSEVRRRWPDRVRRSGGGTLITRDSWPWVPKVLSDAALGDLEEVLVLDAPMPEAKPIFTAISDAEGSFRIPKVVAPSFGVCRAEALATRYLPFPEAGEPITIWMSRPWKLEGHVIDTEGRPLARSFQLAFTGWEPPPAMGYPAVAMGSWITTTRADGSFGIEVAAPGVHARSLEPGIVLVSRGKDPKSGSDWVYRTSFTPESEPPAVLVARSTPVLLVRDAPTHEPIEEFRMITTVGGREQAPWSGGPIWAPGGRLMLLDFDPDISPYLKNELSAVHVFQVWADGHAPATIEVPNLLDAGEIVVDLERGAMPSLSGVVLREGTPIAGATVALIRASDVWIESQEAFVAAARSDTAGRFALEAPEGTYVVRCTLTGETSCRRVEIPASAPIRIDFGREAVVEVRLRDANGAPISKHVVALMGDDLSSRPTHTDGDGLATFSHLGAGGYRVFVPYKTTEDSFTADEIRPISLEEGERVLVEIVFPDLGPRHPRLLVDENAPGPGWRARNRFRPADPVLDVAADGAIPIEIQSGVQELEIQGPDGRRWTFPIPKGSPDGFELRVALEGLAYEGWLRAKDGRPRADVVVCASPDTDEPGRHRSYRALTDASGHFLLTGLESGRHRFRFERRERDRWADDLEDLWFVPSDPPSEHPRPLMIDLPKRIGEQYEAIPTCELSGTVRVAGDLASGMTVSISSWLAVEGGSIVIYARTGMGELDGQGSFRVRVPCANRYSAFLEARDSRIRGPVAFDADPNAISIVQDLDFP